MRYRYARQISIPEIGTEGQEKICQSKIFVVGSGALGSMVAMQLAGAGIGTIGIADFDTVDISNLQRQFFFNTSDAGELKSSIISHRIKDLNPDTKVKEYQEIITFKKAEDLFSEYDFIVDATDNPESKKLIGEACRKLKKPCCIAGIKDFSGQVTTILPEDDRFESYFGEGAADGVLPCSLSGVIGPAAALAASIQVCEVLKYVVNKGETLSGKLFVFNVLENSFKVFYL